MLLLKHQVLSKREDAVIQTLKIQILYQVYNIHGFQISAPNNIHACNIHA